MTKAVSFPNALFVGGTDTSVGKTLICASMLHFLHQKGIRAGYQKWVSTGDREQSEDEGLCRKFAPDAFGADQELHVPYRFSLPASPHLAAQMDGAVIDAVYLRECFSRLRMDFETLIIEGVGGMLVPLTSQLLLADLVAELELSALLVCRSGLGTINHTLLTMEACRMRNIPIVGLVFSDEAAGLDERIVADNLAIIGELSGVTVLGRLPYAKTPKEAVAGFAPLGEKLLRLFP